MRNRRLPVRRRQAVPRRDPRYAPRAWWRPDAQTTAFGLIVLLLLVGTPLLVIGALGPSATPTASGLVGGSPGSPRASGSLPSGQSGTPPSTGTAAPTATPVVRVPLVPVVGFWSPARSITLDELQKALAGTSKRFKQVIVPTADRKALAAELGLTIPASIRSGDAAAIREAVTGGAFGVMRAADVNAAVRVLSIGDRHLFGTRRLKALDQWPLGVEVAATAAPAFDPAKTFTIVAVGDILLDRGVYRQVEVLGKGVDFPYDGGTAEITGSTCCSGRGYRVPTYRRTGDKGAMRKLLTDADLALANLESPVDDGFRYHTTGTVFSGDPKLLDGVQRAGFDFVSLGNNHIGDAGRDGVLETMAELAARDIAYSGAGTGPAGAAKPAILETHGLKMAVIGCDAVAREYWVADRADSVGSRPCATRAVARQVADLKSAKQADIVIVYPHWGREYNARPTTTQRNQAKAWVEAGADLVIGNHAHWAAAVEEIEGRLAFYALGNFVFDQMWQAQTMQGLVLELTFEGTTLRQAWLHPTLVIDQSQPNFLEPAGDGAIVIKQVRDASKGLFP